MVDDEKKKQPSVKGKTNTGKQSHKPVPMPKAMVNKPVPMPKTGTPKVNTSASEREVMTVDDVIEDLEEKTVLNAVASAMSGAGVQAYEATELQVDELDGEDFGRDYLVESDPGDDDSTVLNTMSNTGFDRTLIEDDNNSNDDATQFSSTTGVSVTSITGHTGVTGQTQGFSDTSALLDGSKRIIKHRFVLEEQLGSGGMGSVFKAKDLRKVEARDRNPYVAVKLLNDDFEQHPDAFISLQREAQKSQRLAHPNIVSVFDFDRDGDTVFMTMEYLEGQPLDEYLKANKKAGNVGLSDEDAYTISEGMSLALIRAHAENIIHSDFKPGNVFYTNKGEAKVFDFGIARAVQQSDLQEGEDSSGEKTLFDPGSLGALTPAYASLEMLQGKEPDPRDDIYALACVVYQLYTGVHPFKRTPADKALARSMKPKRVQGLNRFQWAAIEKGLAFKREDRTQSVEEFWGTFTHKPPYKTWATLAVVLVLGAVVAYKVFLDPNIIQRTVDMASLQDEVEVRVQKERVEKVLSGDKFVGSWEERLWEEVQSARLVVAENDDWLAETDEAILDLYLDEIESQREAGKLVEAQRLMDSATRYAQDFSVFKSEKRLLALAVEKAKIEREQREAEDRATAKLRADKERELEHARLEKSRRRSQNVASKSLQANIDRVRAKLKCSADVNMRHIGVELSKLKEADLSVFRRYEPEFSKSLASCVEKIGASNPDKAKSIKTAAIKLFPNNKRISNIKLAAKNSCSTSLAGLGGKGLRATCWDKVLGVNGPRMVVIPEKPGLQVFAISKYEVSIAEMNVFCKSSVKCGQLEGVGHLPATNIPLSLAKDYAQWLSAKSNASYHLPTQRQWTHAAKAKGGPVDPNRNCYLDTKGIKKGDSLVKITSGKQNAWGLVNHVGNAQEWVYVSDIAKGSVVAVGGAHLDKLVECQITRQSPHSGQADAVTGFRLVRKLR